MQGIWSKAPHLCHNQNRSWLGYRLDGLRFKSQQGKDIFIFSTTVRLALRPTQPCLQLVLGFLIGEMGVWACETDHSSPSRSEVKNEWSYYSLPLVYLQAMDRDKFTPFFKTSVQLCHYIYGCSLICECIQNVPASCNLGIFNHKAENQSVRF